MNALRQLQFRATMRGVIVLYDDECGFCRWSMGWALQRSRHILIPVPIRSTLGARLLADLDSKERLVSMHVVRDDGIRLSGGTALRELLNSVPSASALAKIADLSPRTTAVLYVCVARHRQHFGRLVRDQPRQEAEKVLAAARTIPSRDLAEQHSDLD